jgi:hypothetical protein
MNREQTNIFLVCSFYLKTNSRRNPKRVIVLIVIFLEKLAGGWQKRESAAKVALIRREPYLHHGATFVIHKVKHKSEYSDRTLAEDVPSSDSPFPPTGSSSIPPPKAV